MSKCTSSMLQEWNANEILKNTEECQIYLGDSDDAMHVPPCVNVVINCAAELEHLNYTGRNTLYLAMDDSPSYDPTNDVNKALPFILKHIKNKNNIFIHCHVGKSRSATICLAFLMYYYNWSLDSAYKFVKERRPIIRPNIGFMNFLTNFSKKINKPM